MNMQHTSVDDLDAEEASRLAVTATAADLQYWAERVAVRGQVSVKDLVGVLDALRAASASETATPYADLTASAA